MVKPVSDDNRAFGPIKEKTMIDLTGFEIRLSGSWAKMKYVPLIELHKVGIQWKLPDNLSAEEAEMKTKYDYQKAVDEIAAVCQKHGVFLLGTCESDGIYGEITLGDSANPEECGWAHPSDVLTNSVVKFSWSKFDAYTVSGIGWTKEQS